MARILVVDDNLQNAYMLEVLLKSSGHEVETAANGAEAMEKALSRPPDLIVSDILMPVMDGFTLCREWKAEPRLKKIPFLIYTATYVERKDEELALSLGADRFIIKPQEPDVLLQSVHDLLEEHAPPSPKRPREPAADDAERHKEYSEALFRKLEKKMADLERANAALLRSHEELEDRIRERTRELVQSNAALLETTRTLEELVQASPAGIFVLDSEGRVILWNLAMEKILGWTEEEVRGRLVPAVAAGQKDAKENMERLLAGERLAGMELRRHRKDGQSVDLLLWTAPLREENRRLKSTIVILLDVTRLKEMERIALSRQKLASLGQVAVGIAHEIRNPLSGINLYLHSLEKFLGEAGIPYPELQEKTESIIASMKSASTKMESVIQRVLAFSRPGPPRMEPLDVNACIREAVDMARISLQKAGARVAVALREDLPLCRGEMRLLEQALINLLTNAAQALEKQEGERMIEISSSLVCSVPGVGCHVTVSVADSGPGMPEAVRERIFDPYFTTKSSGTGVDLSITHRIVSDHGGFIQVGTSRWGGTLFTIGLPAGDKGDVPAV